MVIVFSSFKVNFEQDEEIAKANIIAISIANGLKNHIFLVHTYYRYVLYPMKKRNLKIEQGKTTRNRLLGLAKRIFSDQGYEVLTLDKLIKEAGVTKGAFYHHFSSKKALFEEVYYQAEDEVAECIKAASEQETLEWDQLLAGCDAYLEAFADPGLQRILKIDGPSVLGWERWCEIDAQYGSDKLEVFLEWMRRDGIINVTSTKALVHQLLGAMNEATFWIIQSEDQETALLESKMVLRQLLDSIRTQ